MFGNNIVCKLLDIFAGSLRKLEILALKSESVWWGFILWEWCYDNKSEPMSTEMSRWKVWECDVITLCEEEGWGAVDWPGAEMDWLQN